MKIDLMEGQPEAKTSRKNNSNLCTWFTQQLPPAIALFLGSVLSENFALTVSGS